MYFFSCLHTAINLPRQTIYDWCTLSGIIFWIVHAHPLQLLSVQCIYSFHDKQEQKLQD